MLRVNTKREESTALRGSDGQKDEEFSPQRTQRTQRRGEEERIRKERKDGEFSPPRPGRGRRRTQRAQRPQRRGEERAKQTERNGRTERSGAVRETARTGRDLRPVEEERMEECDMGVRGGGEDRRSTRSRNLPWGE